MGALVAAWGIGRRMLARLVRLPHSRSTGLARESKLCTRPGRHPSAPVLAEHPCLEGRRRQAADARWPVRHAGMYVVIAIPGGVAMNNQAAFCVNGYVATPPSADFTRNGTPTLRMRIGWTPRRIDKKTGDWTDDETSFATVRCYSTVARNAAACLHKGDPILLKGTIKIREYVNQAGVRGHVVEITADSIGHDLSRGVSLFTKVPANLGQTALDRLREDVAAGRIRLPGD